MTERIILIVLDSVGAGAAPDAAEFGDEGANTLLNLYLNEPMRLPEMESLGLLEIVRETAGEAARKRLPEAAARRGAWGRARERSRGKDTTIGHWEIAGVVTDAAFPVYPNGFPESILAPFRQATGRGVLANKPASGTVVIEEYGAEHLETGDLIVYTSADSVFQIAAHERIVPPDLLYEYCRIARDLLRGEHAVARVIARPFEGEPGAFVRTPRRHDFSLTPPVPTMLDFIKSAGLPVVAVGKIFDIFAGRGVTDHVATVSNDDGVTKTLDMMASFPRGLIFTNLVDFDMKYGHRNDSPGYAAALEAFDRRLPEIMAAMKAGDLLILTADHGCDPNYPGTDHTRETVPLLVYRHGLDRPLALGELGSFADIAATVCEALAVERPADGDSFLSLLNGATA